MDSGLRTFASTLERF